MAKSRIRGFTLIEMMIVVVIVGILAAIVLPSYRAHVIKANRSAAQQFMLDIAIKEQQVLLDLRSYVAVTATANFPNAPGSGGLSLPVPPTTSGNYTFVVTVDNAATPPTFLVTGTAVNNQAVDGDLTLDQAGNKTPTAKW